MSSKSPSDGDFLGLLLLAWQESPAESLLLKLLQRSRENEEVSGGWRQGNDQWH